MVTRPCLAAGLQKERRAGAQIILEPAERLVAHEQGDELIHLVTA
jgi:hypothetical protein